MIRPRSIPAPRRALLALLPAVVAALSACESDDPTGPVGSEAALAEDFTEQPGGEGAPRGWISAWTGGEQGWEVLHLEGEEGIGASRLVHSATASERRLLAWMDAGRVRDAEMVAQVLVTRTGGTSQARLVVRATGDAGRETGYTFDLWQGRVRIVRFVDGDLDRLGEAVNVDWAPNRWYWMRFRVEGDRLMGRIWPEGEAEPDAWTVERTDGHIREAGAAGLGAFSSTGTRQFGYVALGLDGSPAPLPEE